MSGSESRMIAEFREEIDPIVFAFGALLTVGVIAAFFVIFLDAIDAVSASAPAT